MADRDYLTKANRDVFWVTKTLRTKELHSRNYQDLTGSFPILGIMGDTNDSELGIEITTPNTTGSIGIEVNGERIHVGETTDLMSDNNGDIELSDETINIPLRLVIPDKYYDGGNWDLKIIVGNNATINADIRVVQAPPKAFAGGRPLAMSYFAMSTEVMGDDPDADPPAVVCNINTKNREGRPAIDSGIHRDENSTGLLKFGEGINLSAIQSFSHTGAVWAKKDDIFGDDVLVHFVYTSKQG